jgi:hypothetical protein
LIQNGKNLANTQTIKNQFSKSNYLDNIQFKIHPKISKRQNPFGKSRKLAFSHKVQRPGKPRIRIQFPIIASSKKKNNLEKSLSKLQIAT